jgi:molecular chaperone GrpE
MSADNDNDDLPEDRPEANGAEGMAQELSGLRAEVEALKDRALRAMAEVENVRKRLERERDDSRTYSVTRFARDMLTVADNLNRALAAFPPEVRAKTDDTVKAVLDGVDATARELTAALARHGVKPIDAQGQRFDPNLHQAIAEVPTRDSAPGTVVSVVQPGYLIGDRLLRPAMVTVAKAGGAAPSAGNGAGEGFDRRA